MNCQRFLGIFQRAAPDSSGELPNYACGRKMVKDTGFYEFVLKAGRYRQFLLNLQDYNCQCWRPIEGGMIQDLWSQHAWWCPGKYIVAPVSWMWQFRTRKRKAAL